MAARNGDLSDNCFSCFSLVVLCLYSTYLYTQRPTFDNNSQAIIDKIGNKALSVHGTEINVDSRQEFGQKLRLGHGPIHHSRRQRPNAGFTAKGTANAAHGYCGGFPHTDSDRGLACAKKTRIQIFPPTIGCVALSLCRYPLVRPPPVRRPF